MATLGFPSPAARICGHRPISGRIPAKRPAFRVRSSADAGPDASSAVEEASPPSESPVEASKRTPSLISATNVQKALRGVAITKADHYGRLGIARGTPYDQVKIAYEQKCEELMNQGFDEEEVSKKLECLKESYTILSSEEERRLYDWSLARSDQPDRYIWPFQADITQKPTQPAPPQVKIAYEQKCEELMNQGLDEEEVSKKLECLKESYTILSSEEERRLYDWSLARSDQPDRYIWPFQADITQKPTQPAPPQEPEDVGPTRLVGYFFFAWVMLSFVLSVALNKVK